MPDLCLCALIYNTSLSSLNVAIPLWHKILYKCILIIFLTLIFYIIIIIMHNIMQSGCATINAATFHTPFHIVLQVACHGACLVASMPLGSIAEWRARIGSSWCSLGRPFKTRSPFRGGAGQSQTPLPLNQVVTMVMILIIFTAINLAFRIIWTTGHYRAYLGEYRLML